MSQAKNQAKRLARYAQDPGLQAVERLRQAKRRRQLQAARQQQRRERYYQAQRALEALAATTPGDPNDSHSCPPAAERGAQHPNE